MAPGTTPRRPAPAQRVAGEEIASAPAGPAVLKIVAAHMHDSRIFTIPIQHLRTKAEERLARNAVVLENDGLRALLEHPVESRGHSPSTSEVLVSEIRQQLTRPVR